MEGHATRRRASLNPEKPLATGLILQTREVARELFQVVPRLTHLARNGFKAVWVCSCRPGSVSYGSGRVERCVFGPARDTGAGEMTAPDWDKNGTRAPVERAGLTSAIVWGGLRIGVA